MTTPLNWLLGHRDRADFPCFTLYTRQGCGCCAKARDLLQEARRRHGIEIQEIDIDTDPALVERFGTSVPVVEFDGKVRFLGQINPTLLERLINAELRRA